MTVIDGASTVVDAPVRFAAAEVEGSPSPGPLVVMVMAAVLATVYSAMTHSMLLYGDARAHLDVARHVTDGLRTGLTQLGSVWLPLPHILLVPLVAVGPLWHSGAAGAIVSGLCFVYCGVRIFSIVEELTGSRTGAWVGLLVFASNLNMLYVQSTALTEPVLLACLIGAVYHLTRWMRTLAGWDLAWGGLLVCLSTLTRYEGWALLAVALVLVALWTRLVGRPRGHTEANLVLFGVIACYGIVLWLLYNLIIFGSPTYFLNSAYSAQAINGAQAQFGLLGTKGSLSQSVMTYGWDVVGVVGRLMLFSGAAAGGAALLVRNPERRRTIATFALLLAPVAFEVVSLYAGQTTIRVPQLPPHQMWNDRYGLMALPFCAVAVGTFVGRWRPRSTGAVALGVVAAAAVLMSAGTPLTLADGRTGTSSATAGRPEIIAHYIQHHYRGGRILADDSAATAIMFASGLDLRDFVTVGFHPYFERAQASPATNVAWVLALPGDAVFQDMHAHPDRFARFKLVVSQGQTHLYERQGSTSGVTVK
jgi:hypothetical protein